MKKEKVLVTSALPYANGPIHFGHIAGAYLPADIFVRYKKMKGADVIYICGTDDHGVAITISAEKAGVTPAEHVAKYHQVIVDLFDKMNIRFDNFSSTERPAHYEMSRTYFKRIFEKGYITEKDTFQLYCPKDKMFLPDRYINGTCPYCGFERARGDECGSCGKWLDSLEIKEPKCAICGSIPEVKSSKNWYLRLDLLQPKLKNWIDEKTHWKENVVNFVKGWFNEGLRERAITRDMSWGIPVPLPNAEGKVLYVWFDAPIGYISSTIEWAQKMGDPELWRKYWCDPATRMINFIGKDNIPFHCIVFPAMTMAQNEAEEDVFILAENVPANEFYNLEGRQFSKSDGWYIDVEDFFSKYKADTIRYTICANMPEKRDSEFTWRDFQLHNNSDLADTFGNLANRALRFNEKNFGAVVPESGQWTEQDLDLLDKIKNAPVVVGDFLEKYEFRRGLFEVMELAREGNRYFDKQEPWSTLKTDKVRCGATLHMCIHLLKALSVIANPFIPEAAQKLWEMVGCQGLVDDADWLEAPRVAPVTGTKLPEPEILFSKIEDKQIQGEVDQLQKWAEQALADQGEKPVEYAPLKDEITFEDFLSVDLRVGIVKEAEAIKKSKKLLKLQVDLGFDTRQVIAGIAQHFSAEQMVGKQVVVVANLKPAKLMGHESQGMVLAVKDGDKLTLLTTLDKTGPGMPVS